MAEYGMIIAAVALIAYVGYNSFGTALSGFISGLSSDL
jgi:Flp pilus assembly pilin Flp